MSTVLDPSLSALLDSMQAAPSTITEGGFAYQLYVDKLQPVINAINEGKVPAGHPIFTQGFGIPIVLSTIKTDFPSRSKMTPTSVATSIAKRLTDKKLVPAGFVAKYKTTVSGDARATDDAWVGFVAVTNHPLAKAPEVADTEAPKPGLPARTK